MTEEILLDGKVRLICGDALSVMKEMADDTYDCIVTSPPYWGLRDYGVEGQLGLEHSLGEHIDTMVEVFRELRRILKPTGTLWLNYGDCYATNPNGRSAAETKAIGNDDRTFRDKPMSTIGPIYDPERFPSDAKRGANSRKQTNVGAIPSGRVVSGGYLKPKDLCMVPNRLAIALQEDGWWVRAEIIWGKPNAMPSSVKDRPATAHEKIFLLSKSQRYFYDHAAVRQPFADARQSRDGAKKASERNYGNRASAREKSGKAADGFTKPNNIDPSANGGRNLRTYERSPDQSDGDIAQLELWEISTRAFRDAHFATFPPMLVERCLKAGCPDGGLVLDPFGGAGTVGLVAARLGRRADLIDLSQDYCDIASRRIRMDWMGPDERVRFLAAEKATLCASEDDPLFANDNEKKQEAA